MKSIPYGIVHAGVTEKTEPATLVLPIRVHLCPFALLRVLASLLSLAFRSGRLFLVLFAVSGVSVLAQAPEKDRPVSFSLSIVSGESAFSPGDRVTLALTAKIENGWHLYSLSQPTAEGPKATRISLLDQLPLKLLSVSEQAPRVEFDRNFNFDTSWHAGTAIFRLNTAVMANARSGQQQVRASVFYQVCNSEKCLAPRTEEVNATIAIGAPAAGPGAGVDHRQEDAAFRAAAANTEPEKRLVAFEKFQVDFPSSYLTIAAQRSVLDLLMRKQPRDEKRILAQARKIVGPSLVGPVRGSWLNTVATLLLNEGILLREATEFAEESVKLLGDRQNLTEPQRLKDNLGRTILISQVPRLVTLGRLYLKTGRQAEGESLIREAYAAEPSSPFSLIGMGELSVSRGKNEEALSFFAAAYLSGAGGSNARRTLEAAYLRVHAEGMAGLEDWLDRKYRELNPPLKARDAGKAAPSASGRVVLAEMFTGVMCAPCLGADLAMEAISDDYTESNVTVLMYHVHIPQRDPLTSPASEVRKDFYHIRTAPHAFIDGAWVDGVGSDRSQALRGYARLSDAIEKGRALSPAGQLNLKVTREGRQIRISGEVNAERSGGEKPRLHLALAEDGVRFSGSNGIRFHQMVVRSMAGDGGGIVIRPGRRTQVDYTFDLESAGAGLERYLDEYDRKLAPPEVTIDEIRPAFGKQGLAIVAFIQDENTRKVLQSATYKIR